MKFNSSIVAACLAGSLTIGGMGMVGNIVSTISPVKSLDSSKITNSIEMDKVKVQNEIKTTVGKTFDIKLEENLTTGFYWDPSFDKEVIEIVMEKTQDRNVDQSKTDEMLGLSTDKTWTFKANKPGTYKLTFTYAQPWEKDIKPEQRVVYTIKVSEHEVSKPVILVEDKVNPVKSGDSFSVNLEENRTTGNSWAYQSNSKNVKLISDSIESLSDAIGAPSSKTWTFKATKPGTYKLIFTYAQAWEKDIKPEQRVVYTIKVSEHEVSKPVVLVEDKVNSVKSGDSFSVNLEENRTTGNSWAYQSNSKNVKLISDSIESLSDAIGAPSSKTWTFKATKPGTYKLIFTYGEPLENDPTNDNKISYTLEVK